MVNYVGSTSNTIHMAANAFQARWACRPNRDLSTYAAESTRTEAPVTCKSCQRVALRAHMLADALMGAAAQGAIKAEEQFAKDTRQGHVLVHTDDAALLRGSIRVNVQSVAYWFGRGDVSGVNTMAYNLRRRELELAHLEHLEQLVAEAEIMNRELDLAKSEAMERPEITTPSSMPSWTDEELAERAARCRRFAQRHIDRGDVAEAAEFWFSMWMARREQAHRTQLLPEGHAFK